MIYPQKLSSKKSNKLLKILLSISLVISVALIIINKITTPNIPWASIANVGIIYIWITAMYAINRNTNIAAHVLLQTIAISLVLLYIDNKFNFYGWSISIGVPIILIIANITMFVLLIVSYKKYIKYAIYQLIIVFISILQFFWVEKTTMQFEILNCIAIGISLFNFISSLIFCHKEFYKVIVRKFHM